MSDLLNLFNQFGGAADPEPTGPRPQQIHTNSRRAFHTAPLAERWEMVARVLQTGPKTDRQVCEALGFGDMNAVRPTITRMIDNGFAAETGHAKCHVTGRRVRIVSIVRDQAGGAL